MFNRYTKLAILFAAFEVVKALEISAMEGEVVEGDEVVETVDGDEVEEEELNWDEVPYVNEIDAEDRSCHVKYAPREYSGSPYLCPAG